MLQELAAQAQKAFEEERFDQAYRIASRILSDFPKNTLALGIILRINLNTWERLPEAIDVAKRLLEIQPDNPLKRRLAMALMSSPHQEEGLAILKTVDQSDPSAVVATGRLMEHYLDNRQASAARDCLDKIIASGDPQRKFLKTNYGEFQALRLKRLEEELAAENKDDSYPRMVAVCSVSYSGSTFFSELLGRLKGTYNIGESHTLAKGIAKDENGRRVQVTADNATVETMLPCSVCGPGNPCKTFTIDFRKEMIRSPLQWYKRIAAYVESDVLISSDKNFNHYVELDPLQRFDSVVLFKSPVNSYFSQYKRSEKNRDRGVQVFSPSDYLSVWKRSYKSFLFSLRPTGRHLFISWEMFTQNPYYHMKRVCEYLGIEFDHDLLEREQERDCCFGGNFKVVKQFREKKVTVKEEQKSIDLPQEIIQEIESDAGAAALHNELRRRYFKYF